MALHDSALRGTRVLCHGHHRRHHRIHNDICALVTYHAVTHAQVSIVSGSASSVRHKHTAVDAEMTVKVDFETNIETDVEIYADMNVDMNVEMSVEMNVVEMNVEVTSQWTMR